MDLALTDEQEAFVASSRRLLEDVCSPDLVRQVATPDGPGHAPEVWAALARAGWLGMAFAEEHGGAAASVFDLGLAFREAGRALVPTTLGSTVVAGLVVAGAGTPEQRARLLGPLCAGNLVATLALSEPGVHERLELVATRAERRGSGWVLDGVKAFVPNAAVADVLLVLATTGAEDAGPGFGVFVVPRTTAGVAIDAYRTFGQDGLHEVTLTGCEVDADALLGGDERIGPWHRSCGDALTVARALRCMEMLGGIESVLERTVQYVTDRHQFGVAIGSFQAVQHHLADVAMRLEAGRIAAFRALWSLSAGLESDRELTVAELWLSETYVQGTLIAHQVWGGMGYALEGNLFLWSQRAKTLDLLCGRRGDRLERLLEPSPAA